MQNHVRLRPPRPLISFHANLRTIGHEMCLLIRISLADKSEKFSDRQSQTFGHDFESVERGGINATFY
jgi:hypothetical protein